MVSLSIQHLLHKLRIFCDSIKKRTENLYFWLEHLIKKKIKMPCFLQSTQHSPFLLWMKFYLLHFMCGMGRDAYIEANLTVWITL